MLKLAEDLEFERAAVLRDEIERLRGGGEAGQQPGAARAGSGGRRRRGARR